MRPLAFELRKNHRFSRNCRRLYSLVWDGKRKRRSYLKGLLLLHLFLVLSFLYLPSLKVFFVLLSLSTSKIAEKVLKVK